jgi:hypothetical protein
MRSACLHGLASYRDLLTWREEKGLVARRDDREATPLGKGRPTFQPHRATFMHSGAKGQPTEGTNGRNG